MRFDIVTIFPEALSGFFSVGVIGQARAAGLLEVHPVSYTHLTLPTICSV